MRDKVWKVLFLVVLVAIDNGIYYLVGYNTGYNNGWKGAVANDPLCQVVHAFDDGEKKCARP